MGQTPLNFNAKKIGGTALGPFYLDKETGLLLMTTTGGDAQTYNLTAAAVIKATPGRLAKISIINPGTTGGAFTFNDCATTGAAAASNEIWSIAYNATANVGGAVFTLEWPCATGIVLSAVPTGGSPQISVSYL